MLRRERLNVVSPLRLNSIMIGVLFLRIVLYIEALMNSEHFNAWLSTTERQNQELMNLVERQNQEL